MSEVSKHGDGPLSPLKQAFLALQQAESRIRQLEDKASEPIAIVGMSCRIPGNEAGIEGYWNLLDTERSAVSERVEERFLDLLEGKALPRPARCAALLERVDLFDPKHFGISPREAAGMDPQQRLLLEVSWEALENAGIDPFSLYRSATGVYIGVASHDYAQLQLRSGCLDRIDPHFASGAAASVAAGRLSYVLGLNGPAISIDTACSSSLVAVHLACEALRGDECTAALAGGVNLILSPEPSIAFAQAGMLSEHGLCRAFDALADGFVRGEGCGVVVLKRLSAARMDGDRIHGLILGSAVNQDGASSGLTVPNGLAQQSLLRQALRRSGIEPWQVGYVEAHGTGTALGDPIEAEALGAVFGGSGRAARLPIGSVKTNIGHLESAAGVAGLLKLVLGLQHRVIPGQLHWTAPSPHVRWKELGLEVAASARAWEPIGGRRIGGVSSFGFSGTNAHVVVEGWEEPDAGLHPEVLAVERPDAGLEAGPEVLVLTARSEAALRELVARYASFLKESDAAWSSICWTAATGRAVFAERLAIVACGKAEAAAKLLAWLRGESPAGVYRGHAGRRAGAEAARGETGTEASADRAAAGFVQGEAVDWHKRSAGGNEGHTPRRIALPTYPFQRQRYWIETGGTDRATPAAGIATGQGMLGDRIRAAGVRGQFETLLREDGWVGQHRVQGRAVLPATGHVELMLEAAGEVFGATVFGASHSGRAALVLEDLLLQAPLTVSGQRRVQTVVELQTGGRSRVRIYAEQTATKPGEEVWETVSEAWLRPDGDATGHSIPDGALEGSLDVQAILKRLKPAAAGDGFYDALAARGLDFGPLFRGVRQAWVGEVGEAGRGEALGEIAAAATGTDHANEKWTLPPWWLDACLQVAGLAIEAQQNDGDTALYLPMSMERLELHSLPKSTQSCWSLVALVHRDQDNITANLTLTDHKQSPILQCKNLRFRKVHRESRGIGSLMYRIDWQPMEPAGPLQRTAIHESTEQILKKIDGWSASDAVTGYNPFFAELEALSAEYVFHAFQRLGWPESDRLWYEEDLHDLWQILPQHHRLLHRLLDIAIEAGPVSRSEDGLRFGAMPKHIPNDRLSRLLERFPFGSTELNLVSRCGEALAKVLTGNVDGRELIFPKGESEEMSRLYRDSVPAQIYNEMAADLIAHIAASRAGADTRVLEVGGGTAATTGYVLEALGSKGCFPSEYLFTDISPLLVRRAQSALQHHTFFQARTLDLERDPAAQNVDGKFSIILAVNVLHATSSIAATLDRLKSLLAAEGALILVEVTGKQRWADITVGLLDGWWSFQDAQLRPDYPALDGSTWQTVLKQAGFASVLTLPPSENRESIFDHQKLMLASELLPRKRMLVIGEGDLAQQVTRQLQNKAVLTAQATPGDLAQHLGSSPPVDAVIWISDQSNPLDDPPPKGSSSEDSASNGVERPIRSLLATAQFLASGTVQKTPRLYVVTAGACAVPPQPGHIQIASAPLLGLAAALASETPALRCTRIDCSFEADELDAECIAAEILSDSVEQWTAWRSGKRYAARLQRMPAAASESTQHGRVQLSAGVGIDGLHYVPAVERSLAPDEVEIAVRATALNFRDVLQAMGVVNLEAPLGTDCAGIVLRCGEAVDDLVPGDEVVAIAPGCFASYAIASRALVVRKPESLSFAESAAQAVAYLTADYCLNELAQVRRGERVLIHAAAGGVGLAAVHLCLQLGAEPIATAGSPNKRAFLENLGIAHVYDSRSREFASALPGGIDAGSLDVVLNSLAGEAIDDSMRLLKPGGRFIELGKTDLRNPESVLQRRPGVHYLAADLTPLFAARSPWVAEHLTAHLRAISHGSLPALPVTVFPYDEVKDAFRYMSRAEHIGRVVLERRAAERIAGTHLITGGMRGIGIRLAEWLVDQGASEVILIGRNGPDEEARRVIDRLRAFGTMVKTVQGDIADRRVAAEAVQLAGSNLRGVWHGAGVLQNAPLAQQSWASMQAILKPKMDGAWNLHTLTRACNLQFFVLFSSWASIDGSQSQANHVAANSFLDSLAHLRHAQGLPALSINWGAWSETGAAADDAVQRQLARSGLEAMRPAEALEALHLALDVPDSQIAIASIRWPRYLDQRKSQGSRAFYANLIPDKNLLPVPQEHDAGSPYGSGPRNTSDLWARQRSILDQIHGQSAAARSTAIAHAIADGLRDVLRMPADEAINPDMPLSDLGMDSLLAIELRNVLSGLFQSQFPSTLLFDHPTLRALTAYIEKDQKPLNPLPLTTELQPSKQGIESKSSAITGRSSILSFLDSIEQMSDQDVESFDSRS